jgi:hypothetical protein
MAQRVRKSQPTQVSKGGMPAYIWVLLLVLGLAIAWRVSVGTGSHHPEPRADVTGQFVVDSERYASVPRIAEIYTMSREIPNVLDGLFCYCHCAENFGHRSLLTCFESDHGAGCDVCLEEAEMAWRMTQDGATLDQIREQIDATFARG